MYSRFEEYVAYAGEYSNPPSYQLTLVSGSNTTRDLQTQEDNRLSNYTLIQHQRTSVLDDAKPRTDKIRTQNKNKDINLTKT